MPGETPRCHPWPLISVSWPPGCSAGGTGSQQHRKQSRPHACPPPSMQQDGAPTASTGQQRSQAGTTTAAFPSVLAPAERDTPTTGPGTKLRGLGAHTQSAALLGLITGTHTHTHPEAAHALGACALGNKHSSGPKPATVSVHRGAKEKNLHTHQHYCKRQAIGQALTSSLPLHVASSFRGSRRGLCISQNHC